jgi:TDG/mug DNA glycosylase family protein
MSSDEIDILPDHLFAGLQIVFCGTAAGTKSAKLGLPYAGPGNRFWSTLNSVGLTDRQLDPCQFGMLSNFGLGLTDMAKKTSGADSDLRTADFNVNAFKDRMRNIRPNVIAFNGKKAAGVYLGRSTSAIKYGLQEEMFEGMKLVVLPSTSGAARRYWNENYWRELPHIANLRP